jgi:hypothetical protein
MKLSRVDLAEFMVAVLFAGVFTAAAMSAWEGGFLPITTVVVAASLLFPTYLVLVLMMRRHRKRGPGGRDGD